MIKNAKNSMKNIFADVLSGFDFGIKLEGATMFRFPLRKVSRHNITPNYYDVDKTHSLMLKFIEVSSECLLFLKNIRKISFYRMDEANRLECLHEQSLAISNADEAGRKHFLQELSVNYKDFDRLTNLCDMKQQQVVYEAQIQSKTETTTYYMLEQFGFDKTLMTQIDMDKLKQMSKEKAKYKLFPSGSIAFNLNSLRVNDNSKQIKYKFYNYLPLEQDSPISCHINGHWSLHKENRTHLYEYNLREENVNKEVAVMVTDWNLSLINNIILPLYLRLIELIKTKIKVNEIDNYKLFIANFINILPSNLESFEKSKPYFDTFFTNVYKQLHNINCIPVRYGKSGFIQWYKPSELIFSLNQFFPFDVRKPLEFIFVNLGIKICKNNQLINNFSKYSQIELVKLNDIHIVNAFKAKQDRFNGLDIKDTIFEDKIHLLEAIFEFCLSFTSENNYDHFEGCPLLLTNENKFTKFSKASPLFLLYDSFLFKNKQNSFVNNHLIYGQIFDKLGKFVQHVRVADLTSLLPSALDKTEYTENKRDQNLANFPKLTGQNKQIILKLIQIILDDINIKQKHGIFKKAELLNVLRPIKDWSLIPVTVKVFKENDYGKVDLNVLFPISMADMIIYDLVFETQMHKIISGIDLPTFNKNLFDIGVQSVFKKILVCLNRNEDILLFLYNNRANSIFNNENKDKFCTYINQSIVTKSRKISKKMYENYLSFSTTNEMSDHEIIPKIKLLPIFTDLFEETCCILDNKTFYSIDVRSLPANISSFIMTENFIEDFIQFSNGKNICILKKCDNTDTIFDYLKVPNLSVLELYEMFFKWCLDPVSPPTRINSVLIEHVNMLRSMQPQMNQNMWDILKKLPFIPLNDSVFLTVNKCYDNQNNLFEFGYEELTIKGDLRQEGWREFLIKLGLKTKCDVEDCVHLANTLTKRYSKCLIDFQDLNLFVQELFDEIQIITSENKQTGYVLLQKIKQIKFIPNYFSLLNNSNRIHEAIYSSAQNHLICLEDSASKHLRDFYWIQKNILPHYCTQALEHDNENFLVARVNHILDLNLAVDNLSELCRILTSAPRILDKHQVKELNFIFNKNFSALHKYLTTPDANLGLLDRLKTINLVPLITLTRTVALSPANLFLKNVNKVDRIAGHFQQMPQEFLKYWELFAHLGANEKVTFQMCQQLLKTYSGNQLDQIQFQNVIKVYKMLFYDDLISQKNLSSLCESELVLYMPNEFMKMKKLNELFYADNSHNRVLVKKCHEIKDCCIFDVKHLRDWIENLNYDQADGETNSDDDDVNDQLMEQEASNDDSNFLKRLLLKQLDWNLIFSKYPFFIGNPHLTPKMLSSILVEKLELTDAVNEPESDNINTLLRSESMLNATVEAIKLLSDDLNIFGVERYLHFKMSQVLQCIQVMRKSEIKSYFVNKLTNLRIENSEKESNFSRSHTADNKLNLFVKKSFQDKFEINFYLGNNFVVKYFFKLNLLKYLKAETILERTQLAIVSNPNELKEFRPITVENINQLGDIIEKRKIRFIFILMKMLKSECQSFNDIIEEYKLKSLYNIN